MFRERKVQVSQKRKSKYQKATNQQTTKISTCAFIITYL